MGQALIVTGRPEPRGWNFVLDSLSAGMEPGEMGSIQTVLIALTALSAAMED